MLHRLLVLGICCAYCLFAQTDPSLASFLELTKEQLTAIEGLKKQERESAADRAQRRFDLDEELRKLVEANNPRAAGAAYLAILALDREDSLGIAVVAKGFRDLLNGAQKAKLEKLNEAQELSQIMRSAECENLLSRQGYAPSFMNEGPLTCRSPLQATWIEPDAKQSAIGSVAGAYLPPFLSRYLALTPQQDEALRTVGSEYWEQLAPLLQRRNEFSRVIGLASYGQEPDAGTIGSALVAIRKVDADIAAKESERVAKSRAVLTSEQLPKLSALEEARRLSYNDLAARCSGLILDDEPIVLSPFYQGIFLDREASRAYVSVGSQSCSMLLPNGLIRVAGRSATGGVK